MPDCGVFYVSYHITIAYVKTYYLKPNLKLKKAQQDL